MTIPKYKQDRGLAPWYTTKKIGDGRQHFCPNNRRDKDKKAYTYIYVYICKLYPEDKDSYKLFFFGAHKVVRKGRGGYASPSEFFFLGPATCTE